MASFPNSVYNPAAKTNGQTITPAFFNDPNDELTAIEGGYLNGTARLNSSNSTVVSLTIGVSTNTLSIKDSSGTVRPMVSLSTTRTPLFGFDNGRLMESGSSVSIGSANGMLYIRTAATGEQALYLLHGSDAPTEVSDPAGVFANSSATTNSITVTANGRIENHRGSSFTVSWLVVGF